MWFVTIVILIGLAISLWLDARQSAHLRSHYDDIPTAFTTRISLEDHQKACAYALAKLKFHSMAMILAAGITWLWIYTGLDQLQTLTSSVATQINQLWGQSWLSTTATTLIAGIFFILAFQFFGLLVELPQSLYQQFVLEVRHGFNTMTAKLFLIDTVKQIVLGLIIGVPFIALILYLFTSAGALWWAWSWLLWMAFSLLMVWLYPLWIAPLFNRFTPLSDQTLQRRIEKLMADNGFASDGIFEIDGGKRSRHSNAYFTGFGRARRIVLFDTLINTLDHQELVAVLAHELGHFHHKHIRTRLITMAAVALAILALLGFISASPQFLNTVGLGHLSWSIDQFSGAGILILFSLVMPWLSLPFGPVTAIQSRQHEYQADAFAIDKTSAEDLINALVKLYQNNAAPITSDSIYSMFYDSHPPAALRIAHAENLKPQAAQ